jgi:histidinol-phosphate phosphatase family protein
MSESATRHAVFLDLNGTLVLPVQAERPVEYRLIPGAAEAVALLCDAGFLCPVITVQSRIEKGNFTEAEFRDWFRSFSSKLAEQQAFLEGPYTCPHRYGMPCACKKANGSLYRRAAAELKIDFASSFVVGDSLDDIEAARLLGCRSVLVRTGWHVSPEMEQLCYYIAADVLAAAHWIVASRVIGATSDTT